MLIREEGEAPFIGEKERANPTSNRCGIAYLKNNNIIPIISQDAATGSSDAAPDRADVGNGPDSTTHVSMHASSQLNLALQEKNQFLNCSCVEPYNIDYF